jgi:hypothetical protein
MPDPMENEQGNVTSGASQNLINDAKDVSTGKHLLLMVPDFTDTEGRGVSNTPLNSYLRLGTAHSQAGPAVTAGPTDKQHAVRKDLGEDLAAMVTGFTDDTRSRDGAPGAAVNAEDQEPPQGSDYRQGESGRLHGKGGWRDHSDGNRITTTRGDKVEVIRGNYKLLVLGRQDDPTKSVAGFDNSGGFIDTDPSDLATNGSAQVGLNQSWEWDGSRWVVTTLQGNSAPMSASSNPSITNKTWAYKLWSETNVDGGVNTILTNNSGDISNSTSCGAGSINNDTFTPNVLTNNTHAGLSVVNKTLSMNVFNNLVASAGQETFQEVGVNVIGNVLGGQLQIDLAATAMVYVQACPAIIAEYASAFNYSFTNAAFITNTQTAAAITNVTTAPLMTNTMWGCSVDTHAGVHVDNHPFAHADNHSGVHLDVHGGLHLIADAVTASTTSTAKVESIMGAHFAQMKNAMKFYDVSEVEMATISFKM